MMEDEHIYMLYIYPKNEQEDLTPGQKKTWKQSLRGGQMKNEMFDELLASVQEMDKIAQGKAAASKITEFPEPEVKVIREKVGLSQSRFARLIGVSKRTLENWEQGRRHPTGPAKALLRILEADPEYAVRRLHN